MPFLSNIYTNNLILISDQRFNNLSGWFDLISGHAQPDTRCLTGLAAQPLHKNANLQYLDCVQPLGPIGPTAPRPPGPAWAPLGLLAPHGPH